MRKTYPAVFLAGQVWMRDRVRETLATRSYNLIPSVMGETSPPDVMADTPILRIQDAAEILRQVWDSEYLFPDTKVGLFKMRHPDPVPILPAAIKRVFWDGQPRAALRAIVSSTPATPAGSMTPSRVMKEFEAGAVEARAFLAKELSEKGSTPESALVEAVPLPTLQNLVKAAGFTILQAWERAQIPSTAMNPLLNGDPLIGFAEIAAPHMETASPDFVAGAEWMRAQIIATIMPEGKRPSSNTNQVNEAYEVGEYDAGRKIVATITALDIPAAGRDPLAYLTRVLYQVANDLPVDGNDLAAAILALPAEHRETILGPEDEDDGPQPS